MIPRTLDEWNIDVIKHLLEQGYYEAETFDFKEMLPDSRNEAEKLGLMKTCCAFANSSGGFLVFGVIDAKAVKAGENRLNGFSPHYDFPEQFGSYPQKCSPGIAWDFKNPPISLNNGNVIHVILIPRSWNAPHCFEISGKGSDHLRCFTKRTNKGNEDMSYEEIRLAFLQYYEKRLKLQLLQAELQSIREHAEELIMQFEPQFSRSFGLGQFSLTTLETVLADTYTILVNSSELLNVLNRIRRQCRAFNDRLILFYEAISPRYMDLGNRPDRQISQHNMEVATACGNIRNLCNEALALLEKVMNAS